MKDNTASGDHRNKVVASSSIVVESKKYPLVQSSKPATSSSSSPSPAAVSPPSSSQQAPPASSPRPVKNGGGLTAPAPSPSSSNSNSRSSSSTAVVDSNPSSSGTNFDDDYVEWCDLSIGDLIIDLDADIEKNNVKNASNSPLTNGNLDRQNKGSQSSSAVTMSSQKSSRMPIGAVEHQATVDKGLKMKIKRKSVGSKSETKHEIVKTDICNKMVSDGTASTSNGAITNVPTPTSSATSVGSNASAPVESKYKHNSSKGRSSGHRDKKDKVKEKDRNTVKLGDVVCTVQSPVTATSSVAASGTKICSTPVSVVSSLCPISIVTTSSVTSLSTTNSSSSSSTSTSAINSTNCNEIMSLPSSLTSPSVRLETPISYSSYSSSSSSLSHTSTNVDNELSKPLPSKRIKYTDKQMMDRSCSPIPPEVKESSVCTSVGTITEPECLGPCEPGTSVTLEGIVWNETEGGVLVVNVTWRGKTYVGTLLDCTKHDWAPPRFCDSPTSDLDSRTPKGRGKRGRGNSNGNSSDMSNFTETRTSVHSKLRSNSKGRRGNNNSSAPVGSPAKNDNNNNSNNGLKRKGRPTDLEIPKESEAKAKRNRSASRSTPTSCSNSSDLPQPSSPVLIECPEPNCNKKYKHINGLKYHQSHAHQSGMALDGEKMQTDEGKDVSSDAEESAEMDTDKCSETVEKMEESETVKPSGVSDNNSSSSESAPADVKKELEAQPEAKDEAANVGIACSNESASAIVSVANIVSVASSVPEPTLTTCFASSIPTNSVMVPGGAITSTSPAYITTPVSCVTSSIVSNQADKIRPKVDKIDKNKLKTTVSARPIVPAPTPQVITLSANVNSPHLTSSTSSVTSTLKPIQPKPTILGEPTTVNPALESLKKDKVKHKKKNRDKEKKVTPVLQQPQPQNQTGNRENKPISTVPEVLPVCVTESKLQTTTVNNVKDVTTVNSQTASQLVSSAYNPPISSSSSTVPVNCLDSSLDMSSLPVDSTANDNVQSPAYSDISDANDAPPAPPVLESEVGKDKSDDKTGKPLSDQPSNIQPGYGLYPYYGQPPYLIPSVPPPQTNSSAPVSSENSEEKSCDNPNKDATPDKKSNSGGPMTSSAPSSNLMEYQQKFQQQFYPYSYPSYPFSVDSYRRMQLMNSDSNFKQRFHDEPDQMFRQQSDMQQKESDKTKVEQEQAIEKSSPSLVPGSDSVAKGVAKQFPANKSDSSNIKDKQSENHQILKENIEMRSQMDANKNIDYKAQFLMERQGTDVRQYNYFADKMEDKKVVDSQRKKDDCLPQDSIKMSKPLELSTSRRQSPMTRLPTSSPKTITASLPSTKDSVSQLQSFVKDLSKKEKPVESRKQEVKPQQEGQKPTMETTGPPLPNSYSYMHHPSSFLHPSPHYLSFDPTHPMYRGINPMLMSPAGGYPGGPPTSAHYLPHQLRYDVAPPSNSHVQPQISPKRPQSMEHRQPTKALDLLQQHASQYYSSHKIQELQDRTNKSPSAHPASPSTSSVASTNRDKINTSDASSNKAETSSSVDRSRSPPTQRHLHTHHHTHVGVGYPLYDPYGGKLITKHPTEIAKKMVDSRENH